MCCVLACFCPKPDITNPDTRTRRSQNQPTAHTTNSSTLTNRVYKVLQRAAHSNENAFYRIQPGNNPTKPGRSRNPHARCVRVCVCVCASPRPFYGRTRQARLHNCRKVKRQINRARRNCALWALMELFAFYALAHAAGIQCKRCCATRHAFHSSNNLASPRIPRSAHQPAQLTCHPNQTCQAGVRLIGRHTKGCHPSGFFEGGGKGGCIASAFQIL